MGLFTLVACSEDSYQEADKMNETGTFENTDPQNSVKTVEPAIRYESPYGTTERFEYVFQNDTDFELNFVAIINLWSYDGSPTGNVHHGVPLVSFPYFTMLAPSWSEYTWYLATKMITIPPHTTETISMSGGTVLPVNPSGPTTASGQYFEIAGNPAIMPPLSLAEMNFLGSYGKFVGLEGYVQNPSTGGGSGLALRFPIGPQHDNSFDGSIGSWLPVPGISQPKFYHALTKEVCESNSSGAFPASFDSSKFFNVGGINYTCSLYTTRDKVVVILE